MFFAFKLNCSFGEKTIFFVFFVMEMVKFKLKNFSKNMVSIGSLRLV